ncbi:hypothetical protein K501DRAFT_271947 [Backusella circina FSU 941]|nr:hypothetical protein K501DRAFT_271947 [Backusella circina FSU 941]
MTKYVPNIKHGHQSRSQTAASLPSELSSSNNDEDLSSSTDSTPTATPGSPTVSVTSCGPNEPISLTNLTLHGIHNHLTNIRKSFINEEQINNESYIFKDVNHKCLPIESYVHELASLTHIFFLCKNQHSEIAEKIFTLDLLKELASTPEIEAADANLRFPLDDFMTITTAINNLSLEKVTREIVTLDVLTLAARMNYGPKRLLMGTANLDPERLIHLRWTDAIPNENGNSRPDSVIIEKKQLAFGSSLGFGEAKIQQGSCSKFLCLDTLRLAIFTKNAIDVHKLDGALAFQIHGFNVTFYLNQVAAKGIYTFKEIAHVRFLQSLEDLPSFFTLINIQKLLMVNHIFWNTCKKSQHPDIIHSRYKETQMSLDAIIDSSQDSTRQCVLRFGH